MKVDFEIVGEIMQTETFAIGKVRMKIKRYLD